MRKTRFSLKFLFSQLFGKKFAETKSQKFEYTSTSGTALVPLMFLLKQSNQYLGGH